MITHDVMTGGMMNSYCREIMQVEGAFCSLAQEIGVKRAFLTYAAEDAVIHRDGKLFRGHAGIEEYFDISLNEYISLKWEPDHIDVSSSGDLGYTYGSFILTYHDAERNIKEASGTFHTVWKRQTDGRWLFVWD